MSHTEIPTTLLSDAHDIIQWIDNESGRSDAYEWRVEIKDGGGKPVDPASYDFVVRFTNDDLKRMQPLLKWLDYIAAVWAADGVLKPTTTAPSPGTPTTDGSPDPW